ncbi:L,D-transpeptidase family protein [Aliiroseovarius sp.]|uniref:L,D-transpeptidase family protein n=1 Tax=Aliiroseovarius sp. TaxID=1872442 RepID=UPI002625EAEA|nr:L,D-transpeptidase family protein [Aliiroseovarius sp.]
MFNLLAVLALFSLSVLVSAPARAQSAVPAFAQAVAEAAAMDEDIAAFYRENGYQQIWTGTGNRHKQRRAALLKTLARAGDHGLPVAAYDTELLKTNLRRVGSTRELGRIEVEMSRLFLLYARHVQSGVVAPKQVARDIFRDVPLRNRKALLAGFAQNSPSGFLKSLAPTAPEYARLMKEKLRLENLLAQGGWGDTVSARSVKPGASGDAVVALRNRLVRMGYLRRSATRSYDADLQRAVQLFQIDHGLEPDGVAGEDTMKEINRPVGDRLKSVIVTMERERWMNIDRGARHIWVNLTDFTTRIIDDGKVTFETRSVIGKNRSDTRSPEFSDEMEHMIVNPTWNVPRSIAVKEYLPALQRNPQAAGHMRIIDVRGQLVDRSAVDFTQYSASNFPFDMKQPPSNTNALGLVKFMFPNRHNIYLHDTPEKSLFGREVRAFSHGCVRLQKPFEFGYALLARQTDDPRGTFHRALDTGRETQIDLEEHVPVHIVYRTAVMPAKGRANYRRDVYGRDAKLWNALAGAGVALRAVQG